MVLRPGVGTHMCKLKSDVERCGAGWFSTALLGLVNHNGSRFRPGFESLRGSVAAKLSASAFWHRSSRPSVCTQAPWICLLLPWAVVPLGTIHHPTAAALPLSPARGPAPKVRCTLMTFI